MPYRPTAQERDPSDSEASSVSGRRGSNPRPRAWEDAAQGFANTALRTLPSPAANRSEVGPPAR